MVIRSNLLCITVHVHKLYLSKQHNKTTLQKTAKVVSEWLNFVSRERGGFLFLGRRQNARDELTAFFSFAAPNSTQYKIITQTNTHERRKKQHVVDQIKSAINQQQYGCCSNLYLYLSTCASLYNTLWGSIHAQPLSIVE